MNQLDFEIKFAKFLIEESKISRDEKIFQELVDGFIKLSTKIIQKDGDREICLALAITRSPIIKEILKNNNSLPENINIPDIIIDELHFKNTNINKPTLMAFTLLYGIELYNIDYKSITIKDLFDYVLTTNCISINYEYMSKIKKGLLIWCFYYELFGSWILNSDEYKKFLVYDIKKVYEICQEMICDKEKPDLNNIYNIFQIEFINGINKKNIKNLKEVLLRFAKNDFDIF